MKPRNLLSWAGLFFLPLLGHMADLKAVPFKVTSRQFESGDSIIIQEVLASSPQLKVGDTVIVRARSLSLRSKNQRVLTPLQ